MSEGILVINAGSSSIKFSVFASNHGGRPRQLSKGQIEGIGTQPHFIAKDHQGHVIGEKIWTEGAGGGHSELFRHMLNWVEENLGEAELKVAGHRVVHGGLKFSAPTLIEGDVIDQLEQLVPLAPLHQPHNLAPIKLLRDLYPELPQVACFDTAFHRTNPDVAQIFAIPRKLTEEGVRRYGFHGLSYEYIAHALPRAAPRIGEGRAVVAHLGNGASMCAINGGKSIASTMGFTAVDGLPMGTRTGTLDAGVVLHLMQHKGMNAKQIETLLYKESGLLGVSGISNDMRVLLGSDEPSAQEAVDLFCYRIVRETGSLAAAMGGLDVMVFTAGIGEHAWQVREKVCAQLGWLGIELDPKLNQAGETWISSEGSKIPVLVIPTDEEMMIAQHTREVMHQLRMAAQ